MKALSLWTNKQTGQKLYAPDISMQGHKKNALQLQVEMGKLFVILGFRIT